MSEASLPRFIDSQRLLQLQCDADQEREFLRPERFRLRRLRRKDGAEAELAQQLGEQLVSPLEEQEGVWEEVEQRERFLTDPGRQHLCLTIGGGIGKTTSVEQTQYLRQLNSRQLVLLLDISELPTPATSLDPAAAAGRIQTLEHEYLDTRDPAHAVLVAAFRRQLASLEDRRQDPDSLPDPGDVLRLIRRKIRAGELTLIVDALDQIDESNDRVAQSVVAGLRRFLSNYPQVRCVVSGRPWAVQHFYDSLFGAAGQQGRWTFAQVDEFQEPEIRDYLGEERADALRLLEADLMAVPRFLDRLRRIKPRRLNQLRTGADVYWESLQPLLEAGCQRQQAGIKINEAIPLLSLLAFQMTLERKFVRVPPGKQFDDFRQAALRTGARQLGLDPDRQEDRAVFVEQLNRVAQLNVGLKHLLMDTRDLKEIHWQDATLQAFLTAVWITRYAGDDERRWLGQHLLVEQDRETHFIRETWRFSCEMPGDPRVFRHDLDLVFEDANYVAAMELLLRPAPHPPVRSNEMIYRCWPAMLRLGGFLKQPVSDAHDVAQATLAAQRTAAGQRDGSRDQVLNQQAREAVLGFLGEFPARLTRRSQGDPHQDDERRIAQAFDDSFRKVPADSLAGELECWMSSESAFGFQRRGETHRSRIDAPFLLAATPVTNDLYALFDSRHIDRIPDYRQWQAEDPNRPGRPDPRCPVAWLTWFDAWAVSVWLHGHLPTEQEWEYACRAAPSPLDAESPPGPEPRYGGMTADDLENHAWYSANSDHEAHPVAHWPANAFGLHDMYGNVWEWTASFYADDARKSLDRQFKSGSRVLRGGSFSGSAGLCRSSWRSYRHPALADHYGGVRVARARKP